MESDIRILLVRHGETEWNRTHRFQGRSDIELNQTGINQANAVALMLKSESIDSIYASPLIRARETARIIQMFHPRTRIIEEEGFIEMDLGEFDGMEARHWAQRHPEWVKLWQDDPGAVTMPGGESLAAVQNRAVCALKRIVGGTGSQGTVLICSHNFVILSLLCYAGGLPLGRFRDMRQANGALSIVRIKGDALSVDVMNQRPLT